MIDTLGSPWLAYALLLLVTAGARLRCGSWFAPAAFVGLVWSFFVGASLTVSDYPVPGRGLWMLVLLIVAVQLGAVIAHELQPNRISSLASSPTETLDSLIVPCRRYGLLCTVAALAGCVYFLYTSLEEFNLPFTWIGVLEVGARWSLLRLEDALEPWSVRLLITWFHPAGLLGGVLFACSRKRLDRVIAVFTLLPAVAYGALTGARAAIVLGLTCWIGGYAATLCVRTHTSLAMFSPKRLVLVLLAAVSMVYMFASIDAVRDSSWTQAFAPVVNQQKVNDYMFGSPAAFANWYAHAGASDPEWGYRTFSGEFDLLHLKKRVVGKYTGMSNVVGTAVTNIYTLFRDLIEDFTVPGATLISIAIGGLAGWTYRLRSSNVRSALFWLSAFYALILFSPIVSLFSFNGPGLAWVIGWFVVVRTKWRPSLVPLSPLIRHEAAAR